MDDNDSTDQKEGITEVLPFPEKGPHTDAEKYDAAVHRQNGTTKRRDSKPKTTKRRDRRKRELKRLIEASFSRMFGPPGQETRTHWADGSAKTPEELKLKFVKPPTPEKKARIKLARRISKVLIAKKVPAERLKKMLADSKAYHGEREDFLDGIDARLGRIERALRMRRRVRP